MSEDQNLDPVAQALEGLRKAGGKSGAELPRVRRQKGCATPEGVVPAR